MSNQTLQAALDHARDFEELGISARFEALFKAVYQHLEEANVQNRGCPIFRTALAEHLCDKRYDDIMSNGVNNFITDAHYFGWTGYVDYSTTEMVEDYIMLHESDDDTNPLNIDLALFEHHYKEQDTPTKSPNFGVA